MINDELKDGPSHDTSVVVCSVASVVFFTLQVLTEAPQAERLSCTRSQPSPFFSSKRVLSNYQLKYTLSSSSSSSSHREGAAVLHPGHLSHIHPSRLAQKHHSGSIGQGGRGG